jgi:hypothetical protein
MEDNFYIIGKEPAHGFSGTSIPVLFYEHPLVPRVLGVVTFTYIDSINFEDCF